MNCLYWNIQAGCESELLHCSAHSYRETPAREYPWVELSPQRYLAVIIMGQCDAQIVFSLRAYGIALGGMEVLLLFFSQAELAWIPWKLEEMWSSAHLVMPTMEGISLETKLRRSWTVHLHNRAAKNTGSDAFLGWWSVSDTISSVGYGIQTGFISVVGC